MQHDVGFHKKKKRENIKEKKEKKEWKEIDENKREIKKKKNTSEMAFTKSELLEIVRFNLNCKKYFQDAGATAGRS